MKIGYPCINNSVAHTSPSTFRLVSYSENRLIQTVRDNLIHLNQILKYNVKNNLLFFRISSDLIPFASHPICKFSWYKFFQSEFKQIGDYIKKYSIRITMHPDQFVILNSPDNKIVENSINELKYHCKVLDTMCLDDTAKVQIHVGGVYGNKLEARDRFIKTYNNNSKLVDDDNDSIRRRLVIENDDRLYSLKDCLQINQQTGIPIVLDSFHHECYSNEEQTPLLLQIALQKAMLTWKSTKDGLPIVDYSSQDTRNKRDNKSNRKGKHAETIDTTLFRKFLKETEGLDFDIMLEIKDKEKSALKALGIVREHRTIVAPAASVVVEHD
jgi:UV DNA damage endonuclease